MSAESSNAHLEKAISGDSQKKKGTSSKRQSGSVAGLAEQVRLWILEERRKQMKRIHRKEKKAKKEKAKVYEDRDRKEADSEAASPPASPTLSTSSSLTDGSMTEEISRVSLDHLEQILAAASSTTSLNRKLSHKRSLGKIRTATPALDTDPTAVPTCDVTLGIPEDIGKDAFKREVLKLAHTLGCKGWRKIALDDYSQISIDRISGALTNAVYMVSPPQGFAEKLQQLKNESNISLATPSPSATPTLHSPINKLLLRIYGAQVENLIDRDSELAILRRLARQKIGPRLLGTFKNGRFEEFYDATTLTKNDIREPTTSTYIAKRMRELHDGLELEEEEIKAGPCAWLNIKKWDGPVRAIEEKLGKPVLGYPWAEFSAAVTRYREWIHTQHPETEKLVFAHNDTQYGNIMRKRTPVSLTTPHKSLIVIDFEYAGANARGFDIGNHFCEWMADYHAEEPYLMHADRFPSPAEIRRFCAAYVEHAPSGKQVENPEAEVERLMEEAKIWVPACNALWCAWGVVQAKMGELGPEDFDYVGYAKQKASLFWGDMEELGLVTREENERKGRKVMNVWK